MSKPWPLRKKYCYYTLQSFRRTKRSWASVLALSSPDRQTDRQSVSTLFRLWRNFFFFSFFSNIIALFMNRRFFGFSFFFFFLTVLNFLQNSYDDVSIIVKLCKRKDSLDIFRQCPLNCRYEFLELEFQSFEVYHPRDDTFVSFTDQ